MNKNTLKGGAMPGNPPGTPGGPQNTKGKPGNNKNNTNKVVEHKPNMIPSLFNTGIKLIPFGLYISSILESVLFNDLRGFFNF